VPVTITVISSDPETWPPDSDDFVIMGEPLDAIGDEGKGLSGINLDHARSFRSRCSKGYVDGWHWFLAPDLGGKPA
jgi:hypothetical protein